MGVACMLTVPKTSHLSAFAQTPLIHLASTGQLFTCSVHTVLASQRYLAASSCQGSVSVIYCPWLLRFVLSCPVVQRLNGRMAMLGFAGIALAELKEQIPAAEQFSDDVGGVLLLGITLTLASIFPKFVSGSSLKVWWQGLES